MEIAGEKKHKKQEKQFGAISSASCALFWAVQYVTVYADRTDLDDYDGDDNDDDDDDDDDGDDDDDEKRAMVDNMPGFYWCKRSSFASTYPKSSQF